MKTRFEEMQLSDKIADKKEREKLAKIRSLINELQDINNYRYSKMQDNAIIANGSHSLLAAYRRHVVRLRRQIIDIDNSILSLGISIGTGHFIRDFSYEDNE